MTEPRDPDWGFPEVSGPDPASTELPLEDDDDEPAGGEGPFDTGSDAWWRAQAAAQRAAQEASRKAAQPAAPPPAPPVAPPPPVPPVVPAPPAPPVAPPPTAPPVVPPPPAVPSPLDPAWSPGDLGEVPSGPPREAPAPPPVPVKRSAPPAAAPPVAAPPAAAPPPPATSPPAAPASPSAPVARPEPTAAAAPPAVPSAAPRPARRPATRAPAPEPPGVLPRVAPPVPPRVPALDDTGPLPPASRAADVAAELRAHESGVPERPPATRRRALLGALLAVAGVLLGIGALLVLFGEDEPSGQGPVVAAPTVEATTADPTPTPTLEPTPTAQPTATASPAAALAPIRPVLVLNNSRIKGLAARSAERFRAGGWPVSGEGNYRGGTIAETTVYYPAGQEASARRFARQFGIGRVLPRFDGLPGSGLTVVLTRDSA